MAMTVNERIAKLRRKRLAEGWKEVHTFVPSAECAKQLKDMAAEMRAQHKAKQEK